jgi:hypothetical protein
MSLNRFWLGLRELSPYEQLNERSRKPGMMFDVDQDHQILLKVDLISFK